MKKRILSVALAATMLVSSFAVAFAAEYDGLKPLQTAETILDNLNADAADDIFDKTQHEAQLTALKNVNDNFDTLAEGADWSAYIDAVYTSRKTDYITNYMKVLELAEEDPDGEVALALKAVDDKYNTAVDDKSLAASFDKLNGYQTEVAAVIDDYAGNFQGELSQEQISKYVLMATKPVFKAIFSTDGTGNDDSKDLAYNYDAWLANDRAKKLLAILFGEALTKELASNESATEGIVYNVKEYVKSSSGLSYVKDQLSSIFVADAANAVNAAYDFIGNVLYKAYEGKTVQDDIEMLFGGNGTNGAFELAMKALDTDYAAANVWLNLIISEYVQVNLVAGRLNTVAAAEAAEPVELRDNASVSFKTEGLEEYGIEGTDLALRTGWFDIICYAETAKDSGTYVKTDYVTYSNGKIQITKDDTKEENYDAYLTLYRADGTAEGTFVESYPVSIYNKAISTGGSGGSVTRYTVTYESNGGTEFTADNYSKGATIQLTKLPKKDGYVFGGWYLDEALTQKAESVVMNSNITVYAAWVKDGSTVVSNVDVPAKLNGEEHFAYVVGYPDGDVRPQSNITRAETVTILFRLLKDDVRAANLTAENIFTDVNEGDWYNTAVSTLAALEIVNGRTETEFMPNEYITRAEFATIFARFADYEYSVADEFKDVQGHWAENEIHEAAAYGWIAGYEDNTFRPDQRITRAEAMTLINRVLKRNPQTAEDLLEGMSVWNDNSDATAWYYLAIQEATNSHEFVKKGDSYETWTKLIENKDWSEYEK